MHVIQVLNTLLSTCLQIKNVKSIEFMHFREKRKELVQSNQRIGEGDTFYTLNLVPWHTI